MNNLAVSPSSIRSYEPLGDVYLNFGHHTSKHYKRSLDLSTGMTTIEYEINNKRFKRESFISTEYDAIFYRFESLDGIPTDCQVRFDRIKDIQQTIKLLSIGLSLGSGVLGATYLSSVGISPIISFVFGAGVLMVHINYIGIVTKNVVK